MVAYINLLHSNGDSCVNLYCICLIQLQYSYWTFITMVTYCSTSVTASLFVHTVHVHVQSLRPHNAVVGLGAGVMITSPSGIIEVFNSAVVVCLL